MARLNRTENARELSVHLSSPESMREALADADPTATIEAWLRRLQRMEGVPFNYLAPDERMLPNESIRFFNLDLNWIFALVEGAGSIGESSESDAMMHRIAAPKLRAAATVTGGDAPIEASGFLMRSQVVAGWPDLEVVPYAKDGTELTNVLRRTKVSSSILLCVVEGQIDHVVLREPAIGLHFGVDVSHGKALRYVTVPSGATPGTRPGDQIEGAEVTPEYRDQTHRTLRMATLAGDLSAALHERGADNAPDGSRLPFTSAEFALQLVEGTQSVTFQNALKKDE